jgi:hypothetical protein
MCFKKKDIKMILNVAYKIMGDYPVQSHSLITIAHDLDPKDKELGINKIKVESYFPEVVVSMRWDGLTERLNAILRGLAISKKHSSNFKFVWPSDGAANNSFMDVKEKPPGFISSSFCERYLINNNELESLKLEYKNKWVLLKSPSQIMPFINKEEEKQIEYWRQNLTCSRLEKQLVFNDIISKDLQLFHVELISLMSSNDIVGIHYRGGDVIYGGHHNGQYIRGKSLTLAYVEKIIEANKSKKIVVFGTLKGSTLDDIMLLKNKWPNVILPHEIYGSHDFDDERKVINDVLLMSLCPVLYCSSSSGVTTLAKTLGPVKVTHPSCDELILTKELIKNQSFQVYHPLQKTFIYLNIFILELSAGGANIHTLINYIKFAIVYNPDNCCAKAILFSIDKFLGKKLTEDENKLVRCNLSSKMKSLLDKMENLIDNKSIVEFKKQEIK